MSLALRCTFRAVAASNPLKSTANALTNGKFQFAVPTRSVARWVAPTLHYMKIRAKKYGIPDEWKQRSSFIEWNYRAELYAFEQRLHEKFDRNLLEQAFVDHSYIILLENRQKEVQIEQPVIEMKDNRELIPRGDAILQEYVTSFLRLHLPKFPEAGIIAVRDHLLSDQELAKISSHLGTVDIILNDSYPPSTEVLINTLKAIIGARAESAPFGDISSLDAAYNFVRDFVCTTLNHLDINEIWPRVEDEPYKLLQQICAEQKIGTPEPRLIGEMGRNTLLATYHIGIYHEETKKLLGTGYGDSVDHGVDMAAKNALSKIYETINLAPLNYQISPRECLSEKKWQSVRVGGQ